MTGMNSYPEQTQWHAGDSSGVGPSGLPPPSFEESVGDAVVVFEDVADSFSEFMQYDAEHSVSRSGEIISRDPNLNGEEPPEFMPYKAEHKVSSKGQILSHDSHLNEDGEALYRFLLSQAETPPIFVIHCRGTHSETRTRIVTSTDAQGRTTTSTQNYTETVTDFDFKIKQPVPPHATQWTAADEEPAFRGSMRREVGLPGDTILVDGDTKKKFKVWRVNRHKRGLPPWVGANEERRAGTVQHPRSTDALRSSWTLRQWADNYCQSRKIFKEFVYEKVIYGWDLNTLEAAIRATVQSTHYGHHVEVSFESGHRTVIVRPDRPISRAISNSWLKFLLIITLIYPCIWLFQRFHRRGGGRWAVGGSGYALKRRALVGEGMIGEEEGEWLRRWEGTIRRSVMAAVRPH